MIDSIIVVQTGHRADLRAKNDAPLLVDGLFVVDLDRSNSIKLLALHSRF